MNFNDNIYKLGLGIMRVETQEEIDKMIVYAIKNGINYFEACFFYNDMHCETFLYNALKKFPRNSYYLCDKYPCSLLFNQNNDYEKFFFNQLKRMNTDYFDYYLLQAIDAGYYSILKSHDIIEFLNKQRKLGTIKNLGFSFHDKPEIFEQTLKLNNWDIVQLQLNYYDWYLGEGKNLYSLAKKYDLPISVMGGCKGGLLVNNLPLTSKQRLQQNNIHPAYLCYKFLTTLSNVKLILSGANNISVLENNLNFFKTQNYGLSPFEKSQIYLNLEDYSKQNLIQCTNCQYCITQCPQKIPINQIFYLYNNFLQNNNISSRDTLYTIFKSDNSITKCIKCGACERACPQHLPIRELFKTNIFPLRL